MDAFTLDPKTTALVLIDLQKGIAAMPTEPLSSSAVIANANQLLKAFHQKGGLVVFVRVTFSPDAADMLKPNVDEPMVRSGSMPADWAEIVPELERKDGDFLITKRQWGAFFGTELDLQLRRRGITTIVLSGIATNYGVESTARDAYEHGYHIVFAEDAMASRTKADHDFSVTRIFPRIGRVRKTVEILGFLHT